MPYYEIDTKNSSKLISLINNKMKKSDYKTFVLIYMEGCGPCNATRPEWKKLKNILNSDILERNNVMIVAVNKDIVDNMNHVDPPSSFPTMRYITNSGKLVENYEDCNDVKEKNRTVDSFIEWIKAKTKLSNVSKNEFLDGKKVYLIKGGKSFRKKYKKHLRYSKYSRHSKRKTRKYK